MLKEIRINNFKSFNEEVLFTMEACPSNEVSEHEEHVLNICDNRILKISSIYGPNGGGKSNLISAILLVNHLFNEFSPSLHDEENPYLTYAFGDNDTTRITLFFVTEHYEIGYSFSIKYRISNLNKQTISGFVYAPYGLVFDIVNEEMTMRENNNAFVDVFVRDSKGLVSANEGIKLDIVSNKVPLSKEKSFLTYIKENYRHSSNASIPSAIFDLINEIQSIVYLRDYDFFPFRGQKKVIESAIAPIKNDILEMMNNAGIKIDDIAVKNNRIYGSEIVVGRLNNSSDKMKYIPLENESSGTKKLFALLFNILSDSQRKARVYLADDLDSKLHPKLVKSLVEYFSSSKNTQAQLIFNSHDILNMTPDLFRRDEIWFAYRNDDFSTELVPLSSLKDYKGNQIRKDAKYGKQYLEGRYGGDPFIKKGLGWADD